MPQVTGYVICPVCHRQKSAERALCSNCGTKSCVNGHLISQDSNICHQCGWQEPPQKPLIFPLPNSADENLPVPSDRNVFVICPRCKTMIENQNGRCPYCGFLGLM